MILKYNVYSITLFRVLSLKKKLEESLKTLEEDLCHMVSNVVNLKFAA